MFITYIVTSKPKRISVAAGVVHIIISLSCFWIDIAVVLLWLHYAHQILKFPVCVHEYTLRKIINHSKEPIFVLSSQLHMYFASIANLNDLHSLGIITIETFVTEF